MTRTIRVDDEVFALIVERRREMLHAGVDATYGDAVRSLWEDAERVDPPGYTREAERLERLAQT